MLSVGKVKYESSVLPPLGNPVSELRHLGVHPGVSAASVAKWDNSGQFAWGERRIVAKQIHFTHIPSIIIICHLTNTISIRADEGATGVTVAGGSPGGAGTDHVLSDVAWSGQSLLSKLRDNVVIVPGKMVSQSWAECTGIWIHWRWLGRNRPPPVVSPQPVLYMPIRRKCEEYWSTRGGCHLLQTVSAGISSSSSLKNSMGATLGSSRLRGSFRVTMQMSWSKSGVFQLSWYSMDWMASQSIKRWKFANDAWQGSYQDCEKLCGISKCFFPRITCVKNKTLTWENLQTTNPFISKMIRPKFVQWKKRRFESPCCFILYWIFEMS